MKITTVDFTNFGSYYGKHSFNFANRGLTWIMGQNCDEPKMDSNGAGKSQIFDVLDWTLFGVPPRGDHVDSVVNEEAFLERGSVCQATANLIDDGGGHITITRRRSKSKTSLHVIEHGVDKSGLDTGETQKEIERILGIDREIFHAAVLYAQTDMVRYADSTDSERMNILTRILQLGEIDGYLAFVKEQTAIYLQIISTKEIEKTNKRNMLDSLETIDYDKHVGAWDKGRDEMLNLLAPRLAAGKSDLVIWEKQVTDLTNLKFNRAEYQKQLDVLQPEKVGRSVEIADAEKKWERDYYQAVVGVNDIRFKIEEFDRLGLGVCDNCGQDISGEHVAFAKSKLLLKLKPAEDHKKAVEKGQADQQILVRACQDEQAKLDRDFQQKRDAHIRQLADIDNQIASVNQNVTRIVRLRKEILTLETEWNEAQVRVNPYLAQKQTSELKKDEIRKELDVLEGDIAGTQDKVTYLEFWAKAFGPVGLKNYILDSRVQELSDAANQWVKLLTGGTIWVRFEPQKKTRSKKIINAPALVICRWNPDGTITERNYESWSGGEKQRISFAVDFGLSRLIANRAKHNYDLVILDEVDRHLDKSGREAIVEMLQILSQEKSSVLVVGHDADFASNFENIVTVVKKNRRSIILTEESDYAKPITVHQKEAEARAKPVSASPNNVRKPRRIPVRRPPATE